MIAMVVGHDDGTELGDIGVEELLAQIRSAIDQDALASAFY